MAWSSDASHWTNSPSVSDKNLKQYEDQSARATQHTSTTTKIPVAKGSSHLACVEDVPLVEFMYLVFTEDVPLVEFMYLVFRRMPGESYRRRLMSLLLYLCYVFRALINSLVG